MASDAISKGSFWARADLPSAGSLSTLTRIMCTRPKSSRSQVWRRVAPSRNSWAKSKFTEVSSTSMFVNFSISSKMPRTFTFYLNFARTNQWMSCSSAGSDCTSWKCSATQCKSYRHSSTCTRTGSFIEISNSATCFWTTRWKSNWVTLVSRRNWTSTVRKSEQFAVHLTTSLLRF